jgi:hypothetical protein
MSEKKNAVAVSRATAQGTTLRRNASMVRVETQKSNNEWRTFAHYDDEQEAASVVRLLRSWGARARVVEGVA